MIVEGHRLELGRDDVHGEGRIVMGLVLANGEASRCRATRLVRWLVLLHIRSRMLQLANKLIVRAVLGEVPSRGEDWNKPSVHGE